jgi:hypothetical protein
MIESDPTARGFRGRPYLRRSDGTAAYEDPLDTQALTRREVFRVEHHGTIVSRNRETRYVCSFPVCPINL